MALSSLPEDAVHQILRALRVEDVCAGLRQTSSHWNRICNSDTLWKMLVNRDFPGRETNTASSATNKPKPSWESVYKRLYTPSVLQHLIRLFSSLPVPDEIHGTLPQNCAPFRYLVCLRDETSQIGENFVKLTFNGLSTCLILVK